MLRRQVLVHEGDMIKRQPTTNEPMTGRGKPEVPPKGKEVKHIIKQDAHKHSRNLTENGIMK